MSSFRRIGQIGICLAILVGLIGDTIGIGMAVVAVGGMFLLLTAVAHGVNYLLQEPHDHCRSANTSSDTLNVNS